MNSEKDIDEELKRLQGEPSVLLVKIKNTRVKWISNLQRISEEWTNEVGNDEEKNNSDDLKGNLRKMKHWRVVVRAANVFRIRNVFYSREFAYY